MTTPLTIYPVHAAATTLTTATLLVANSSGTTGTGIDTAIGTATGYSEIFTRGTSSAWQALGAIGNPSGNGYLYDVTTLEGQGILAGNWTPTIRARINTGNGNLTADFYIRYYKYNGGVYTPIATVSQTGNTLTSTSVNFTLPATALPPIVFGTGDKLYIDVWYNVTANANTLGTGTVRQDVASSTTVGETNAQFVTPGYAPTNQKDIATRFRLTTPGTQSVRDIKTRFRLMSANQAKDIATRFRLTVANQSIRDIATRFRLQAGNQNSKDISTRFNLATPGYRVLISGQTVFVIAGTLSINSTIGKRSTASFTVKTDTSTHFQQYQPVSIFDPTNALIFSGYITQPKETKPGFQPVLEHTITCADQHFLADKRVVAASYVNTSPGFIVTDILNNILSTEGVTVGQIYDSSAQTNLFPSTTLYPSTTLFPSENVGIIPNATFVYCTVAQAMDALVKVASAAGVPYYWQIDQFMKLWFVPYTAVVNSTVVDGTQIDDGRRTGSPPQVTRANPTYRNTQYLLGGMQQTVQQTEIQVGDGNKTAFTMAYALASAPTISTNTGTGYVLKSVGLKGTTGSQWYWAQGDPVVTQDTSGTKLRGTPNNDTVKVVYFGQYPTAVVDQNNAQISYEQGVDSTTGIIEEVETDNNITSLANGLAETSQLLTRYAQQGTQLVFNTRQAGFAQGQLVTVNLPDHALYNAQMLLESVAAADTIDSYNIWYTVTAVLGPYDIGWVDFFSALLKQQAPANSINVGSGQSVIIAAAGSITFSPTITGSVSVFAAPVPSTSLFPSTTLFPG